MSSGCVIKWRSNQEVINCCWTANKAEKMKRPKQLGMFKTTGA